MHRPAGDRIPAGLGRLRRRLGFDRNVLRRRIDRIQWAAGLTLAVVFLLAAPLLAVAAGGRAYESGVRAEQHERAARRQVAATVTGPAVVDGRYGNRVVPAVWRAPDGTVRKGLLPLAEDDRAGTHRWLWVDRTGRPTAPPRSRSRTVIDAGYAAGGAVLAVGVPLLIAYRLVRRRCDRVRDAMWDAEWARIDPHRIS
ncbi:hypothetical protein [Thermomonospora sp. CIF 1]|uniref:Rv1733c family protein n=1 Tax=Thermomonospora sp. CIF 1 TaxID=1916083 RepID=UPI000CAA9F4C|nr:hypothetical protein [Thermomonospora sp. CIF 1]PKK13822.1 MAG: hypothetical protein BUE48_015410 [Thermomonospora sp. CIF 1]